MFGLCRLIISSATFALIGCGACALIAIVGIGTWLITALLGTMATGIVELSYDKVGIIPSMMLATCLCVCYLFGTFLVAVSNPKEFPLRNFRFLPQLAVLQVLLVAFSWAGQMYAIANMHVGLDSLFGEVAIFTWHFQTAFIAGAVAVMMLDNLWKLRSQAKTFFWETSAWFTPQALKLS